MFDLKDLYQEVIVDHNRSPRNFGKIDDPDKTMEGYNPLCGDRLSLYLKINDGMISDISFDGSGCAISIASASLMTEAMKGKQLDEAESIFNEFHEMVVGDADGVDQEKLGKLAAIAGVRDYPARVKCATLCWHALHNGLSSNSETTSTE
jgi:nitrogen fixation NifU-like protein